MQRLAFKTLNPEAGTSHFPRAPPNAFVCRGLQRQRLSKSEKVS